MAEILTRTYTYTGSAITPTFTVKDGETPLTEGDYTAVVSDNIAAGTGKIKAVKLMSIAVRPLGQPPFPLERMEEMTARMGGSPE